MKLLSTFLVMIGLLLIQPVLANNNPEISDGNCNKDGKLNCDSANIDGRDYFLKLKYLKDVSFRVSLSDIYRGSSSRYQVSSEKFCAIAYSCEQDKNCNNHKNRKMEDYKIKFTGDMLDDSFALKAGSSTIPVTLRLKGVAGDGTDNIDEDMFNNESDVPGKSGFEICRNNEFVVVAEIDAEDLEGAAGDYEGTFDVEVSAAPSMKANDDLNVELELPPSILISGLSDRDFVYTGKNISDTQKFCVYTSEKNGKFKIKADSGADQAGFWLSNGTAAYNIEYGVTVGRVGGGNDNSRKLNEGVYDTHSSWKGAEDLFCGGGDNENMELTLDIEKSDIDGKPSGVYKDTLYLTVEPT